MWVAQTGLQRALSALPVCIYYAILKVMYYTQFPILGGLPMPETRRLRGQSDPGRVSVKTVRQLQMSPARRVQAEDNAA